jgi:sec-independent protein translocase protein TatA
MSLGPFQLLIIALVLLLLFGRGRVRESLGDLGEGVRVFRKGLRDGDEPAPLGIEGEPAANPADN